MFLADRPKGREISMGKDWVYHKALKPELLSQPEDAPLVPGMAEQDVQGAV